MPRSSRLAIWCLASLLCLSLYIKGRTPAGKGEGAAFLRAAPGLVKVRLAGELPRPGLYLFPDGATVASAIKMTVPGLAFGNASGAAARRRLRPGDVVTVSRRDGKGAVFSMGKMGVKERMLLKVPLHPDELDAVEWAELPGIGPALSARIITERHKNGAFGSLEGVLRVPGLGPGRLAALRPYFRDGVSPLNGRRSAAVEKNGN